MTHLKVFRSIKWIILILSSILAKNVLFVSPFLQQSVPTSTSPTCTNKATLIFSATRKKQQRLFVTPRTRTPPLPEINIGLTDDEFHKWLHSELSTAPGRDEYSDIYDKSVDAIIKWRQRFRGNPKLWKRIFKKERVLKELVESTPILRLVLTYVDAMDVDVDTDGNGNDSDTTKLTIMDLCSGKGYLSMFLSELLPPEKVNRIILVDKAWAMCGSELKSHHINWEHIYGKIPSVDNINGGHEGGQQQDSSVQVVVDHSNNDVSSSNHETYFTTWPIRLSTSKQDLKQSCNQRQMKKHFFDKIDGPIIVLAIHLCGTLSIKAVDMFNNNDNVSLFALKPCCLPSMIHAQRGDVFQIGTHEFNAADVCSNGKFKKKDWTGPPRWHLEGTFHKWADNLYQGIDLIDCKSDNSNDYSLLEGGRKNKQNIVVQVDGGFQNTYIFAQRSPLTKKLWSV